MSQVVDTLTVVVEVATQAATAAVQRFASAVTTASARVNAAMNTSAIGRVWTASMAQANQAVQNYAQQLGPLGTVLTALGPKGLIAAAGIAAIGAAALVVADQVRQATRMADEISDTASAIGVSAEFLQVWREAAERAGVDAAQATSGISAMMEAIGRVKTGNGDARVGAAFEDLGIDRSTVESWNTAEEALREILDALQRIPDQAERMRLASSVGLAGIEPMAREGAAGIDAVGEAAREAGLIMDEDMVQRAAEAEEKFRQLERFIAVQLAVAFAPVADSAAGATDQIGNLVVQVANFTREIITLVQQAVAAMAQFERGYARLQNWSAQAGDLVADGIGVLNPGYAGYRRAQDAAQARDQRAAGLRGDLEASQADRTRRNEENVQDDLESQSEGLPRGRGSGWGRPSRGGGARRAPRAARTVRDMTRDVLGDAGNDWWSAQADRTESPIDRASAADASLQERRRRDEARLQEQIREGQVRGERDIAQIRHSREQEFNNRRAVIYRRMEEELAAQLQEFQSDLTGHQVSFLEAQAESATSAQEWARLQGEILTHTQRQERAEFEIELSTNRKLTDEQRAQLTAAFNADQAARSANEMRELRSREVELAQRNLDQQEQAQSAQLSAQLAMAGTARERLAIERQLLTIEQGRRRRATEAYIRDNPTADGAQLQRNDTALEGLENQGLSDRYRGPLRDYLASLEDIETQWGELHVNGIQAFADGMVEVLQGTRSFGDLFKSVANQIVADLIRMAVQQTIFNGLMMIMGGGGGPGKLFMPKMAPTTALPSLPRVGFASGTDFAPGGLAMVGEKGPELAFLPRGSQVVPNNLLRNAMMPSNVRGGGGGPIILNVNVSARGAIHQQDIQNMVQQGSMQAVQMADRIISGRLQKNANNRLGR